MDEAFFFSFRKHVGERVDVSVQIYIQYIIRYNEFRMSWIDNYNRLSRAALTINIIIQD